MVEYLPSRKGFLIRLWAKERSTALGWMGIILRFADSERWAWDRLYELLNHLRTNDIEVPTPLLKWVADVFLQRRPTPQRDRNPKSAKNSFRDHEMHMLFNYSVRNKGYTRNKAYADVAEYLDVDETTVRHAVKRAKLSFTERGMPDWLEFVVWVEGNTN